MQFDPVLVHDWLTRTAARFPEKIALACDNDRLTYAEVDELSERLAHTIVQLGVERGDRVVIFLDNGAEAVIGIYGVLKAGGVFVVAESTSPACALRHIIIDSGARLLIAHYEKAAIVKGALLDSGMNCQVVWVGTQSRTEDAHFSGAHWKTALADASVSAPIPRLIDIDLAALIYTSGSTGMPKGIVCTHHNMVSAGRSIIQYLENDEHDVILDVLPLAFDYGLYQVIMAFMFGGTVVLERSMGFIESIIRRIEKERVTAFPIVPMISAMLMKMKKVPAERLMSLRYITSTGALWPASHINYLRKALPSVRLYSMYGLTECKRVGYLPPELIDHIPQSVGHAMPNCEALVVNEFGQIVRDYEPGELVIRGSNVMQGYWNDIDTTAQTFESRGYAADRLLHTGDCFYLGEGGFLYYVGRKDDLIKSSGRRVSPREVEDVIMSMPEVVEAAVVGVPDEVSGFVIGVFLVLHENMEVEENSVRSYCMDRLDPYKVPRRIWIVSSLPRTPNGKVDRVRLKEMIRA